MNKRRAVLNLGIIASVAFLYLSFGKIDHSAFMKSLAEMSAAPILLAIVCLILGYFIRAIRWKYILVDSDLRLSHLFSASMIGNMGNNIFPMRIGEIIRCYVLGYQEGLSISRILASVMFERVLDGITVLAFFTISLLFTSVGRILVDGALIAFLVFGSVLLIMVFSKNYQERFFKILSYICYFFPEGIRVKLSNTSNSFLTGLDILHRRKYLMISIIYSLIFWGSGILGIYFVLLSTGKFIPIDLPIILISALVIGVMIPSAPGFIGTYHYVVIVVLGLYGWDKATSACMSVVLHGIQFIVPIVIGLALVLTLEPNVKHLVSSGVRGEMS